MSTAAALFVVVLPVFLLVGSGYAAVRLRVVQESVVDALLAFATRIAVPVLLFQALYRLDLGAALRWEHLLSFYAAATASFLGSALVARIAFGRRPGESVAIGFIALFSNSVLLGLAVLERAYDPPEMEAAFALVAIHAPYCYLVGILSMEMVRRDGAPIRVALRRTANAMFRNALAIGIALGLLFNLLAVPVPEAVAATVDLLARAALPVALFGLGGALTRYAMRDAGGEAVTAAAFSILVHPALAWVLAAHVFALPEPFVRAAVVIAAMPPGINAYLFASMYDRAVGTAASSVLIGTAASVLTATFWLWVLGGAHLG